MGAERVTEELSHALGIKPGETDAARDFTLLEVECLGACDKAPVVCVNDSWHECQSPDAVRAWSTACAHGEASLRCIGGENDDPRARSVANREAS
jgi:NADH:ubiquinone oxidoreductase subunit E